MGSPRLPRVVTSWPPLALRRADLEGKASREELTLLGFDLEYEKRNALK